MNRLRHAAWWCVMAVGYVVGMAFIITVALADVLADPP